MLRLAVGAHLARYKGQSRSHTSSDLNSSLRWFVGRDLDALMTRDDAFQPCAAGKALAVSEARPGTPLKRWQWAEILGLCILIFVQLAVRLLAGSLWVAAGIGLIHIALLVHIATWLIPLVQSRNRR